MSDMTRLIGFTGRAGSGKNEAANALVALGWKQDAFADRMRKAVLALDPYVEVLSGEPWRVSELLYCETFDYGGWDGIKRQFPEARRLLQRFGTEAGRDIHGEDCWVDALFNEYWNEDGNPDFGTGLVVTDCRFDNEAMAIHARGGIVIEIVRPGLDDLPGGNSAHASEAGVSRDLIDHTVYNSSTVENLHQIVLRLVEEVMKRKSRSQIEAAIEELTDLLATQRRGSHSFIELRAHREALLWVLGESS